MKKVAILLVIIMALPVFLLSCNKEKNGGAQITGGADLDVEPMDFATVDISRYVSLGEYKGMKISLASNQVKKGETVWQRVVENATVKEYPEQQLEYYMAQSRARYEYLAKSRNDTYENILSLLGVTEETMLNEARALVKDDIVLFAVLKAENISLSEDDKKNNFDKYVKKFVYDYGYGEDYVREKMTEQIYDTMLFDKMLERLILINEFIYDGGGD